MTVRNTADGATKTGEEQRVPLVGRALAIVEAMRQAHPQPEAFVFTSGTRDMLDGAYVSKRFRIFRK